MQLNNFSVTYIFSILYKLKNRNQLKYQQYSAPFAHNYRAASLRDAALRYRTKNVDF